MFITLTTFKCTVRWYQAHSYRATITTIYLQNVFPLAKLKLWTHQTNILPTSDAELERCVLDLQTRSQSPESGADAGGITFYSEEIGRCLSHCLLKRLKTEERKLERSWNPVTLRTIHLRKDKVHVFIKMQDLKCADY